jgi:hypothetical protein
MSDLDTKTCRQGTTLFFAGVGGGIHDSKTGGAPFHVFGGVRDGGAAVDWLLCESGVQEFDHCKRREARFIPPDQDEGENETPTESPDR